MQDRVWREAPPEQNSRFLLYTSFLSIGTFVVYRSGRLLAVSQTKGAQEMIQVARIEGRAGNETRTRRVARLGDVPASPDARCPRDVAEAG